MTDYAPRLVRRYQLEVWGLGPRQHCNDRRGDDTAPDLEDIEAESKVE